MRRSPRNLGVRKWRSDQSSPRRFSRCADVFGEISLAGEFSASFRVCEIGWRQGFVLLRGCRIANVLNFGESSYEGFGLNYSRRAGIDVVVAFRLCRMIFSGVGGDFGEEGFEGFFVDQGPAGGDAFENGIDEGLFSLLEMEDLFLDRSF